MFLPLLSKKDLKEKKMLDHACNNIGMTNITMYIINNNSNEYSIFVIITILLYLLYNPITII